MLFPDLATRGAEMITQDATRRRWGAAVALLTAGAGACLPIPWTRVVSSPMAGRYLAADGSPVAGARVVLSTADGDSTCAAPAAEGTSDSAGRFGIAATTQRERYFFLVGDAAYCPHFCAGSGMPGRPASSDCGQTPDSASRAVACSIDRRQRANDSLRVTCIHRRGDPARGSTN